ncbi:MAG: SH3 domain-containing protein [Chloroflexi bacterium]|nr:SH3 domain-containing protein [Chloroflexota bacterium]
MLRIGLILLALLAVGCNLTTEAPVRSTPITTPIADTPTPGPSPTPAVPMLTPIGPTEAVFGLPPPPLPNVTSALPQPTGVLGTTCAVYITYSGPDPANLLSLRQQPSTSAPQVYKVPNNSQVLLMPNSQEVEAEGYHWLNVIYVDSARNRYEGWMARDSYTVGGARNPAISTLRSTGQQAPC